MKLKDMTALQFAAFMENIATLLGGTELSAIDSNVRTDLLTAIGTLPATLTTLANDAEIAINQAKSAVATRDETNDVLLPLGRQVRNYLEASNAPKDQWDLCGFDYPDKTRSTYNAQTPLAFQVTPYPGGLIKGKFKGNNASGSVLYEVWRREGDEGVWALHIPIKTTSFNDEGVTPGQYYEYKVRARATKTVSLFTPSAVAYGMN